MSWGNPATLRDRSAEVIPGYVEAAQNLDWNAVKADIENVLTTSQDWWPTDYTGEHEHYGGFIIRLAWHCAGSYRRLDGRGGCDGSRIRFDPERSWEDNANLEKARQLLWGVKERWGLGLSWSDLIVLAGTVAIESMGGPVMGFCPGRIDASDGSMSFAMGTNEPGSTPEQLELFPCAVPGNCQFSESGAMNIGLIYVDAAGPMGVPTPNAEAADHIRQTFERMGMNDSETVALTGGGHAFGKCHGACPEGHGPSPQADPILSWPGLCPGSPPENVFTSGFHGAWTENPTVWDNKYFEYLQEDIDNSNPFTLDESPAGAPQWVQNGFQRQDPNGLQLIMLTADLALARGGRYEAYVTQFAQDQSALDHAFMHAWYKLVTRDMGPYARCIKTDDLPEEQPWQFPLPSPPPASKHPNWDRVANHIRDLMQVSSDAMSPDFVNGAASYTAIFADLAYQCSSSFRVTDWLGGCNGARIMHPPGNTFADNQEVVKAIDILQQVKDKFGEGLTWADLIVFAGQVAIEDAATAGGVSDVELDFCPGRSDAPDGAAWEDLYPINFNETTPTQIMMVFRERATLAGLTVEEAVALQARPRSVVLQQARGYSGSWTSNTNLVSNRYFRELLTNDWVSSESPTGLPEWSSGDMWMTNMDMAIAWDGTLRHFAQLFSSDPEHFMTVFTSAWTKMMINDRFDGPVDNVCFQRENVDDTNNQAQDADLIVVVASIIGGALVGALLGVMCLKSYYVKSRGGALNSEPLLHNHA
jgi:catalase/peroxidase HPI